MSPLDIMCKEAEWMGAEGYSNKEAYEALCRKFGTKEFPDEVYEAFLGGQGNFVIRL